MKNRQKNNQLKAFIKLCMLLTLGVSITYLTCQVIFFKEALTENLLLKSLLYSVVYTLLLSLAYIVWFATWRAVLQKPYLTWGLVGGGGFLALAGVQAFVKKAEYYTAFQTPFVKAMIVFDVLLGLLILVSSFLKARSSQKKLGLYAKLLFFFILNGFFLNMLTIPTGINTWQQFLPFAILAGVLDLLLGGAWLEQASKGE